MKEPLWWQSGVLYQIYPRSFLDTDEDGIGNLAGVTQKADYLKDVLGIDAVWLSPFFPSPMADFGYDVSDYESVDPMFGTLQDFDAMVQALHERGIKVIIDYVINHTSDLHPWFQESKSSRDNPKRDWYVWTDPKPDGSPPNNWRAAFGGGAWEWDEATGQFYLHSFLKEQPDLNWRNPKVQQAMFDVLRFWMDRGVDGFRVDAAHFVGKDAEMRDNPPDPDYHGDPDGYDIYKHVYDKGNPFAHEVFRRMRKVLDEYSESSPRMAIAEIHMFDWPHWASYYGKHLDEMHMPFNFGLIFEPWTAEAIRGVVEGVEAAVPEGGWPNYVIGNHDTSRVATRIGAEQARVAMMLILTLRGTPTMYYGEELTMHDVDIPQPKIQDPAAHGQVGKGRDPERTPMQWNDSPNSGFASEVIEPWLPVADDIDKVNVEAELQDRHSMLALTQKLLHTRRESPALQSGRYWSTESPKGTFVYYRELADERWVVALNFTDQDQNVPVPLWMEHDIVSTYMDRHWFDHEPQGEMLSLRPNEGVLIRASE